MTEPNGYTLVQVKSCSHRGGTLGEKGPASACCSGKKQIVYLCSLKGRACCLRPYAEEGVTEIICGECNECDPVD